jgi:hypothetical protein
VPPASALPGPDHPAPRDTAPDAIDRPDPAPDPEPDGWRVERSVDRSPLEAAEDAFGWLVTGTAPLSLHGIDRPSLPRRAVPLHQLRTRLAAGRVRPRDRDAIWAALIYRARTASSPTGRARWRLGCVGVALPILVPMAARLSVRYPGDPADLEAAILAAFLAELGRVDICTPDLPARLTGAAERAAAALAVALYAHDHTNPHDAAMGSGGRDASGRDASGRDASGPDASGRAASGRDDSGRTGGTEPVGTEVRPEGPRPAAPTSAPTAGPTAGPTSAPTLASAPAPGERARPPRAHGRRRPR